MVIEPFIISVLDVNCVTVTGPANVAVSKVAHVPPGSWPVRVRVPPPWKTSCPPEVETTDPVVNARNPQELPPTQFRPVIGTVTPPKETVVIGIWAPFTPPLPLN